MKRALSIALVAAALIQAGGAQITAQPPVPDGPLTHFNSSYVTGDVVVGGASLFRKGVNGRATQNIVISGVPAGAEILAAYLYIQTTVRESQGEDAGMVGATFKGNSLFTPDKPGTDPEEISGPIAKALNWGAGTQACWSYGWNPRRRLVTYRADVLRFLAIGPDGKHIANGPHVVQVPDAGRFNKFHHDNDDDEDSPNMTGPRAVGASLVLIYRHPNRNAPLRAITIYDGGFTKRSHETFTQRIQGVFQPTANPDARMTHIVGDGQPYFLEKMKFGTLSFPPNPFKGHDGPSFPRWDNQTFNLPAGAIKNYPDAARQNTVSVTPFGPFSDCLSWSAIVVSAKVQDSDGDGLLDLWESWTGPTPILDPIGRPLPLLSAMGANPLHKDIFTEIAYLETDGDVTYGQGAEAKVRPAHTHKPTLESLKMVHEAFRDAPVSNPDGVNGINVHFDVGNDYQTDPDPASPPGVPPFIIPWTAGPGNQALGGKSLLETEACTDAAGLLIECPPGPLPGHYLLPGQYPFYPGTVGWKTGFRIYRDELFGFAPTRRDIFRYALYIHHVGIPQSEDTFSPNYHIPITASGIGDWSGADVIVALGAFDNEEGKPVGTHYMQGATLMHEWGHTMALRHGGALFEPNCKPQYQSVMNYLYQLRGLPDEFGIPRLDYNIGGVPDGLNENTIAEGALAGLRYRIGWYAPKATSYLKDMVGGAATKHCDGSPLPSPPGVEMVRVDAVGVTDPIDWNANGTVSGGGPQDINFDGLLTPLNNSFSDWANLRMNQVAARRTPGGLFLDTLGRPTIGPLSLNVGKGDLGKGDLGKGDLGKGDLGIGALGKGDLGKGDLGKGDLGKGDLGAGGDPVALSFGKGDLGKGDLGGGDLDVGSGAPNERIVFELDFTTAIAATGGNPTPPSGLQACLTDDGDCAGGGGNTPVLLTWLAPNIGRSVRYLVYRFTFEGEFEAPAELPTEEIAEVVGSEGQPPPTSYLDFEPPPGANVAYFVIAQDDTGRFSGVSNFATVTTPEQQLQLAFVDQPADSIAGQTMPAVSVAIQTAGGAIADITGVPITLAISNNPSEATLTGILTRNTVEGVATFPGLSINNSGEGYTLVASADGYASTFSAPFDITVASNPLVILTESVPDATLGAPYSQTLAAQGGVPPYSWSIATIEGDEVGYHLPAGLTLDQTTGLISGTPEVFEVRSFRVRVTDANGADAWQDLCIKVGEATEGPLAAVPLNGGAAPTQAQILALAEALAGGGVTILDNANLKFTGAGAAVGSFTGGFGATGLNSGIILSSGGVANVNGPNSSDSISTANGTAGDAQLNALLPPNQVTNDAAVLEFDFVVTNENATTVKFDYVFASEEYNEFANSQYNDAFAFFITGPEYPTPTNVALVPNTNIPVTINNVNLVNNPGQFVNNSPPPGVLGTQADGLTKVFTISANVTPGETIYHLKIAIADVTDFSYDSWVMLKAGSFGAVCPVIPGCPGCGQDP